jgi:hypothetical protein
MSFLEDSRRLIEAGKGRRWEVFKWTMAANAAFIATAYAYPNVRLLLFLGSLFAAAIGTLLIIHYNIRMTGAGDRATNLIRGIQRNIVPISAISGQHEDAPRRPTHDIWELAIFLGPIWLLFIFGVPLIGFLVPHSCT